MSKKMEVLYDNLAEYYVFDKSKYTLEEFFTDLKAFKDSFYVSRLYQLFYEFFFLLKKCIYISFT